MTLASENRIRQQAVILLCNKQPPSLFIEKEQPFPYNANNFTRDTMTISSFKGIVERNFNAVLIISLLLGLFMPGANWLPATIVPWLTGIIIFLSCSKINIADIKDISILRVSGFYLIRFMCIPLTIFLIADYFNFPLAHGLFLLSLMPVTIALPALSNILGGNVTFALGLVITSSFVTPFIVPAMFELIGYNNIELDTKGIFSALCLMIFLPVASYFPAEKTYPPLKKWATENSAFISTLLFAIGVMVAIADQREFFFENLEYLLIAVLSSILLFLLLYVSGAICSFRAKRRNRIVYILGCGAMNSWLAISLAILYFPDEIILFTVISEIPWILALPVFKLWLDNKYGTSKDQNAPA